MSRPRIVIKMRSLKKRFANHEMLYLAIILSLLRADPESFLSGIGGPSPSTPSNDMLDMDQTMGDMWIQTQSHQDSFGYGLGGNDLSPRLHPKNYESMLERFQDEILEDLNNLGRYDRIRHFLGQPVEISAYVLNADNPNARQSSPIQGESDHDSGISDTELHLSSPSDSEDSEVEVKLEDEEEPLRVSPFIEDDNEAELEVAANPYEVFGGQPEFVPDEEDVVNELIHIDDQLHHIDENLDEISDEFLHLDEQLAVHLQDEEEVVVGDNNGESNDALLLDDVDFVAQPFDDWLLDAHRDLEEFPLVFTDVEEEKPTTDQASQPGLEAESSSSRSLKSNGDQTHDFPPSHNGFLSSAGSSVESSPRSRKNSAPLSLNGLGGSAAQGPHHGPVGNASPPSGEAPPPSSTDTPLWTNEAKYDHSSLEDLLRSTHPEGLLRNVSLNPGPGAAGHTLNDSFPTPSAHSTPIADLGGFGASGLANLTNSANTQTQESQSGSEAAPFGITDTEIIKEIFNVFGGRDLHEVENWAPLDPTSNNATSSGLGGRHGLRSEGASTLSHPTSTTTSRQDSGCADDPYHSGSSVFGNGDSNNSSAMAAAASSPYAAAMLSAIPGYSGYNPYLAAAAGRYPPAGSPYTPLMNHSYAAVAAAATMSSSQAATSLDDLETASHTSGKSNRSKDFTFDPSSIKREPDDYLSVSGRARHCRDEKKSRELGITFTMDDIINLPMDEFNDMLSRQELTEEQLNLCRDIRRRGKNKVAAQNCRKRKIDQIAQLEEEVHRARTRKQNLLMERENLFRQRDEWRSKLMITEEDILANMGRAGKDYRLDFSAPEVRIIRREEMVLGGHSSVDQMDSSRFVPAGSSSSSSSQHPNFNWKSDSNQHS